MEFYKNWLPTDEHLRKQLQDYLINNPRSIASLSKAIGISPMTVTSFMNGSTLVLVTRIKIANFLKNQ